MDLDLTPALMQLRDGAHVFAKTEILPTVATRDRESRWERSLFMKMGAQGLLGAPLPRTHEGRGYDAISTCMLFEGFGRGAQDMGLATAWVAHTLGCAVPIWRLGSDEQRAKYLGALAAGRMVGTMSLCGPDDGFDIRAVPLRAERKNDKWLLNGTSAWVRNAPVADVILAAALTSVSPPKLTLFLVDTGALGVHVGAPHEATGLRTCPSADVTFEDCEVDDAAIVGGLDRGLDVVRTQLCWRWSLLPAPYVGLMDALLGHSIAYAKQSKHFGKMLAEFQEVRTCLARMKMRVELGRRMVYRAACQLDATAGGAVEGASAMLLVMEGARDAAMNAAIVCADEARRRGQMVERVVRDATLAPALDNAGSVLRSVVAGGIADLSGYGSGNGLFAE